MNASNQNPNGFMLLFVGMDWHKGLSPEQTQKVSEDWMAWFKRLCEEGKAVAGHPLGFEGKSVSGKNRAVTDGPFAEAKEAIGGYFMLDVATMDEAVEIARQCPGL
ncbi:MAG: YciI family protein, partial [Limisphaerales bacterium]